MSYIIKMALDIKAGFEPPAPMTSPLEAYCAVGTIARAMKLGMPERKDTLFEMRDQLDGDMGGNEPEDSRIARIHAILPLDVVYEEPPASAAIRLSPDQRFLYVSTRFAELITVFKISHGRLEQIQ